MSKRTEFVDYVKHGGNTPLCSPQIGCGAGFDSKLSGDKWIFKTTLEKTLKITRRFNMHPLFNVGIDPFGHCEKLKWKIVSDELTEEKHTVLSVLSTPYGDMVRKNEERPFGRGGGQLIDPVTGIDDLDKFEYAVDTALAEDDFSYFTELSQSISRIAGDDGSVSLQWSMQPYEMLSYPSTLTNALLPFDCERRFFALMDKIFLLDQKIISAIAMSDVEFVFLGGPAAEMISPDYYEKYIVPYSKKVTDFAHSKGLLIYSHICSPIEPMLSRGFYNEMGIDLFETLSPPPEGNIKSFEDALGKISPEICTRGNVSLSKLITGTPDEIRADVRHIIEASRGRKHIVAASDYLMYDVKEENVRAMCDEVQRCTE